MEVPQILIVDDIPKNLQILGNVLAGKGYKVAFARSGEEALRILENSSFDLILLDIMMPGIDGFETCRQIRKIPKEQDTPIIFLSARIEQESIVEGFHSGGQDYITKPFQQEELLARVSTHLDLRFKSLEVKKLNQHLEQKVDERTHQLKKAYKKLERLDEAKNNFLALVSHELRTPLNALNGFSEMLSSTTLNEEQEEYLDYMRKSSNRLMRFADAAILISQLESQSYQISREAHNIRDVIEEAIIRIRAEFPECQPIIKQEIPVLGSADDELILKAMMHVIRNACQHNTAERPIEINISKQENMGKISIRDFGEGFSEEVMNVLFKKFSGDKLMHHSEGLGLGLATVRLIIQAHEGDIRIFNHDDDGGVVEILLPLAQ